MFGKLRKWLSGSLTNEEIENVVDFVLLHWESIEYLRHHQHHVLSTELPYDQLKNWLLPMPSNAEADDYIRNYVTKKNKLSKSALPIYVFDEVLKKRFNRNISMFNEPVIEAATKDFKNYILLLNYISRMRESGQYPIEFDIFDVENYAEIIERIDNPTSNPTDAQPQLSYENKTAQRAAMHRELADMYFEEIMVVVKKYGSIDISLSKDAFVYVTLRNLDHLYMNPALDVLENSRGMFVDRIEYEDDESFSLYLTEAKIRNGDFVLPKRKKSNRTNKTHHIVIIRGESMTAPFLNISTYGLLRETVRRYDAYRRGFRKKIDVVNKREMNEELNVLFEEIKQVANKYGLDNLEIIES